MVKILDEIKNKFSPYKIVVRSSAMNEDTLDKSMAGCFDSMLNISTQKDEDIENAIKQVLSSYKNKTSESSFNQVLIQPHTKDIVMSGVIFTRTLEGNAPYYVINYDDTTGSTDSVTSGVENKSIKISKFAKKEDIPKKLTTVIESVKEIESLIPKIGLDIEFALNKKGEIIIFQTRPLTTSLKSESDDKKIKNRLDELKNKFNKTSKKQEHLAGEKTILADMPDWNPAEIIGDTPNYLDYSLYDYIITKSAWHEARTTQGYYNVNPAKLVVLFGNKPYIDVRNSFNSFVPASLSKKLHDKLVDSYLKKLKENPELQDKVEFDVVYSCYDLMFDERIKELSEEFTKEEINELKSSLITLTNNLILNSKESIPEDIKSVEEMEEDREKIINETTTATKIPQILKNSKFLLDDCRKKGTVQFSRLARLGFIGKIILKSMIKKEIIDEKFYDNFMNSISTVATKINEDFKTLTSGDMTKEEFINKYYHLRPGSYDITSLRYDSNPELLKTIHIESENSTIDEFSITKEQENKITNALKKDGLKFDAKQFLDFARSSFEAREYAKFEFTKNLSDAIELIALAGEEMGFTRSELATLGVEELFNTKTEDRTHLTELWKAAIKERSEKREINKQIVLPPIIFSDKDFDIIRYYIPRPNFITSKKIRAALVKIDSENDAIPDIEGKIVMIENGDPGYDWVFTRNIAGLITKYGGVASHMSIRCAEFGIPAAIGCGILFDQLKRADGVLLDCTNKKITKIKGDITC